MHQLHVFWYLHFNSCVRTSLQICTKIIRKGRVRNGKFLGMIVDKSANTWLVLILARSSWYWGMSNAFYHRVDWITQVVIKHSEAKNSSLPPPFSNLSSNGGGMWLSIYILLSCLIKAAHRFIWIIKEGCMMLKSHTRDIFRFLVEQLSLLKTTLRRWSNYTNDNGIENHWNYKTKQEIWHPSLPALIWKVRPRHH